MSEVEQSILHMWETMKMNSMEFIRFFIFGTIPDPICRNHTLEIFRYFAKKSIWALRMVDSVNKIPVGVMTGNLVYYGNIDECLDVKADGYFGNFTGKHCMVHIKLPALLEPNSQVTKLHQYRWGMCIPSSCSAEDLKYFLRYTLHLPATVNELECLTSHDYWPYQAHEIFTFAVIGVLLLLMVLSTLYDIFSNSDKKNKMLMAFSFPTNFKSMLNTKTSPGSIKALHGIRFFAIACVILTNVYIFKGRTDNDINRLKFKEWLSDWWHVWLTSRGVLVDAFFVLGGLLVSYVFMRDREKRKKFNYLTYSLHRYLRIAPAMIIILLFEATLANRLDSSSGWRKYSNIMEEDCQRNWWKHILFIHNWWGVDECMEHTWYLSVDMQLHLLSPLLLIPLHRRPKLGLGLMISALVVAFFTSFGLSYGLEEKVDLLRNDGIDLERKLYQSTYHRITPWIIGLLLGYFLFKKKHLRGEFNGSSESVTSITTKLTKFCLGILLWIGSISLALAAWCAVHPFIQPDYEYNAFESATYLASSHILASLFTVTSILLILADYGGPFYVLFSWKFFVPLSRLSYCMYLIHFIIIKVWMRGARYTEFLSDFNLVMFWIGALMSAVVLSPIVFLMVEQPFTIIERILLNRLDDTYYENGSTAYDEASTLPISETRRGGYTNNAFELPQRPDKVE